MHIGPWENNYKPKIAQSNQYLSFVVLQSLPLGVFPEISQSGALKLSVVYCMQSPVPRHRRRPILVTLSEDSTQALSTQLVILILIVSDNALCRIHPCTCRYSCFGLRPSC